VIGPLFQELINSSVDGILAFDQEYRVTVWNPAMARLFGVSQAKVIGNFAFTVFPFFKETGEDAYYAQALAGKTVVARNRPYVNFQTGQAGFFEGHYSPLMDETGHIVGGMAVIRDITDQKRMLDEMAVLSQVSQAVTSTLDTGAILDMIIAHTTRLLRAAATSVALTDETRGDLYFATAYGENAEFVVGKRLTMGQGIAGWVAQCGQPVLIPDTSRDSRFFKDFDQMGGFTTRSILCVPLQTKGQTVGVIEAMNKESGPFNDQDLRLLALLAAPAATAIEHARLYEQAQREIAERMRMESAEREQRELAEALRDTIAALSSTLNLDKLLERILANVGRVVPHDAATIMLVENDVAQVVGCRGFSRRSQSNVVGMKMPLAQNATLHQMSQTGQPLTIATLNPAEWSTFPQTGAAQSYTGAPIRLKGETVGFINLESATAGFFAPEHGLRLQAFADQASLAIQNARLLAAEREQRQLAEKLREAAAALTSALDLSRVLDNILTQLQQVIPYDSACVFLIEAGTVRAVAGRGFRNLNSVLKIRHPVKDDPLLNEMLKFRQPVYLPDAKADRRFVQWTQAGSTRGWLGVPLIVRDRVIGHLALDSR
jgi:PAS domain S-box-containing protein